MTNSAIEYRVSPSALRSFCGSLLTHLSLPTAHSTLLTDALIEADLRGTHTHGVSLLPRYTRGFQTGELNARPNIRLVRRRGASAILDGDNGIGHVVGVEAMRLAIDIARSESLGAVVARNSNHFGAAAYFTQLAAAEGFIGLATTNTPPLMAAWGGRTRVLGNNPISWAIPTGPAQSPIVLDMALTVAARGKIRMAAQKGKKIPIGWATDSSGKGTTDPHEALQGLLMPVGGAKGYGLAVISEILAGALADAATTVHIADGPGDDYLAQRLGHFMLAINIESFLSRERFYKRVRDVVQSLKSSPPLPGSEGVLLPGEPEALMRERQLRDGILLDQATARRILQLAISVGVPPPKGLAK